MKSYWGTTSAVGDGKTQGQVSKWKFEGPIRYAKSLTLSTEHNAELRHLSSNLRNQTHTSSLMSKSTIQLRCLAQASSFGSEGGREGSHRVNTPCSATMRYYLDCLGGMQCILFNPYGPVLFDYHLSGLRSYVEAPMDRFP